MNIIYHKLKNCNSLTVFSTFHNAFDMIIYAFCTMKDVKIENRELIYRLCCRFQSSPCNGKTTAEQEHYPAV